MSIWRDPVGWWCALGRPLGHLSRKGAIAVLLALVLALGWSAIATSSLASADDARVAAKSDETIGDLELYSRIHTRFAAGENYYAAAMSEQRQNNYPTAPFVTVRQPTLAWVDSMVGETAWQLIAGALLVGTVLAWLGALSPPVGLQMSFVERVAALMLLVVAAVGLFDARALQFHELIAGMLLTLALGLYRTDRWWPSLLALAAALALRELVLPFALLWGAFALSQKKWREFAAIAAVLAAFAIGMWLHAQGVAAHSLPDDLASPGWLALNGPQMALFAMSRLTGLLLLPIEIAAPVALLALLGWIGLGGRLGLFASLWFIGFGLALSLFARTNNFYWVLIVLPAYAAGLAFVPRAIAELAGRAIGRQTS